MTVIYLQAKTKGLVTAYKALEVTVCGLETVSATVAGPISTVYSVGVSGTATAVDYSTMTVFSSSDSRCPLHSLHLYSDSGLATEVSSQTVASGTAVTQSVPQTTAGITTYYYVGKTEALQLLSVACRFIVCGKETVAVGNSTAHTIEAKFDVNNTAATTSIVESAFAAWFSVSAGSEDASYADCTVQNYYLCSDSTCATLLADQTKVSIADYSTSRRLSTSFSHFANSMHAARAANSKRKVTVHLTAVYTTTVYVGAVTRGYNFATRPLFVNVTCGNEVILSTFRTFSPLNYQVGSGTKTLQYATYFQYFTNDIAGYCPITAFSVGKHSWDSSKGSAYKIS